MLETITFWEFFHLASFKLGITFGAVGILYIILFLLWRWRQKQDETL